MVAKHQETNFGLYGYVRLFGHCQNGTVRGEAPVKGVGNVVVDVCHVMALAVNRIETEKCHPLLIDLTVQAKG